MMLLFACTEPVDSAVHETAALDPGFEGPVGRQLSAMWVTWIREDGTIGTRYPEENLVPDGEWLEVSGQGLMCARSDTKIECWSTEDSSGVASLVGNYVQVSSGRDAACVVDASHRLTCWGVLSEPPAIDDVASVSVGEDDAACVIDSTRSLVCWGAGMDYWMSNWPRYGGWVDVAVGKYVSCALDTEGHATCWGVNQEMDGNEPDPVDVYAMVSAGQDKGCAMTVAGGVSCWQDPWSDNDYSMQAVGFLEISATSTRGTCGLPPDGDPICSQDDD